MRGKRRKLEGIKRENSKRKSWVKKKGWKGEIDRMKKE